MANSPSCFNIKHCLFDIPGMKNSERSVITSQSTKSRSVRSDERDRHSGRRDFERDEDGNRRSGDRYSRDSRERYGKEGREHYQRSYGGEYSYKRSRYDGEGQTPGERLHSCPHIFFK